MLKRIFEYANKTNIVLDESPWTGSFRIKGFSPHLRQVHVLKGVPKNDECWTVHDILHIFFYDFAYIASGRNKNLFLDQNRFYEIHLASEAFAVLALDYFFLSRKQNKTITIDFYEKDWVEFSEINPKLPYFKSDRFIKALTQAYLSGDFDLFKIKKPTKKYKSWINHEVSYSKKQRAYVTQWWNDLNCKKNRYKNKEIVIYNSAIDLLVVDAIHTLYMPQKSWANFLKRMQKMRWPNNYFRDLKKFKALQRNFDFRFTDFRSLTNEKIKLFLTHSKKPNAGILFLMWQIFAQFDQSAFSKKEKLIIEKLYRQAQKSQPEQKIWNQAIMVCIARLPLVNNTKPNTSFLGNFFLQ